MNYTPLDDAFKIQHTNSNTYGGTIKYTATCIYCKNPSSKSLMNDGGAFRQCERCRKNFMATVVNPAIHNFSYSTHHLKGTN
jgi:hypothetical protein